MNVLIIGNGFDLEHTTIPKIIYSDFIKFLKLKGKFKTKFNDDTYKKIYGNNNLWSEFENYCKGLDFKMKAIFYNDLSIEFTKWIDTFKIDYANVIKSEFVSHLIEQYKFNFILSFNYTDTSSIYNFNPFFLDYDSKKSDWNNENLINKYINLHRYKKGKKYKYIIGSDQEQKYNKDWMISRWEDKKNFNPKKIIFDAIVKNIEVNNLVFYGFSFGLSDKNTILFLLDFIKGNRINRRVIILFKDKNSKDNILANLKYYLKNKLHIKEFIKFIKI